MYQNAPYGFVQGLVGGAPDQHQHPHPLQHQQQQPHQQPHFLTGYPPPAHPEPSQHQLQQSQSHSHSHSQSQSQSQSHSQSYSQSQIQHHQLNQPQHQPQHQHHLGLPPPHFMYHPQHYGQSPYGPLGVNPGLMQNTGGRAHMPADNGVVQGYQTPYTSSPYGVGIPSSTGPSMPQSYMTPTSNAPSFGVMNNANLTAQQQQHQQHQQQQRMQPPVSTPIPPAQRVSPYGGVQQSTPPQATAQSQFMTPGNPTANQAQQMQIPLQTQQQNVSQTTQAQGQRTPQTPSFPGPVLQAPLSPTSESREKERVSTLLDINRELLEEVIRLQHIQAEAKKETGTTTAEGQAEKPSTAQTGKDFVECMRRLQANLAYLAAIADRSHKPLSQIPPHPAIISAPPLMPYPNSTRISSKASSPVKNESTPPSEALNGTASANEGDILDQPDDRGERLLSLKQLYAHLHTLFPGVDPTKEPPLGKTPAKGPAPRPNPAGGQNANPATNLPGHAGSQSGNLWQGAIMGQQHQAQMMGNMGMAQAQNAPGPGPGQAGR